MEQNFQTSFIPKKPMIEQQVVAKRPVGVILIVSIFIFITMVLVSGGAYFYKGILEKSIVQKQKDLNLAKNRFEPSKIFQLKNLDTRLQAASEILSKHTSISPIFKALQDITLKTVRYTSFSYAIDDQKNKVMVSLTGQAQGYRSIALQTDVFNENKNFIDPVFSGLVPDEKGNINFNLSFSLDRSFIDYKQVFKIETEGSSNSLPVPGAENDINDPSIIPGIPVSVDNGVNNNPVNTGSTN